MSVDVLAVALRRAWSAITSSEPSSWSPNNPALGQCAVTALIVQDELGGDLIRATNGGVSHYWNRLPDGTEVDLTREQFETWEPTPSQVRDRAYVLSFAPTLHRYNILRSRLGRGSA